MNIFKWIGVHILGTHCPECGGRMKFKGGRVWECVDCGHSEEEKS